jgi:hypothetical protein
MPFERGTAFELRQRGPDTLAGLTEGVNETDAVRRYGLGAIPIAHALGPGDLVYLTRDFGSAARAE